MVQLKWDRKEYLISNDADPYMTRSQRPTQHATHRGTLSMKNLNPGWFRV